MIDQQEVEDELQYIEHQFEFSQHCPKAIQNYIIDNNLVCYVEGNLMISSQGELEIGYSKAELRERYDDKDEENNEVYSGEYENEDTF